MLRFIPILAAFAISTAARAMDEVPFVTTPDNVTLRMLEMAGVGARDYVIDLGSGDGRIVIVAASRFGARGLGVEIVADLVRQSRENARAARVAERVEFREQDLFEAELGKASVITMYLLPEVNLALRPKILALKPGTRIVSHDWDMADWAPDRTTVVDVPDKKVGLEKSSKVHLWIVPANIDGPWCGSGKSRGTTLAIEQKFQQAHGIMMRGTERRQFDARLNGLQAKSVDDALVLALDGFSLRVVNARDAFAPLRGASFTRRAGDYCS